METQQSNMYRYYLGDSQPKIYFNTYDPKLMQCVNYCSDCNKTQYDYKYRGHQCTKCQMCMGLTSFQNTLDLENVMRDVPYGPASRANKECGDFCDPELCEAWQDQLSRYHRCLDHQTLEQCRQRFGCKQWRGSRYRYTPPLPPKTTNCELCWINNYTNI